MRNIDKQIDDPVFKDLFDIPKELYEQSSFLRSIKDNYLRFSSLSDKQVETFKKVVDDLTTGRSFKREQERGEKKKTGEEAVGVKKIRKVKKPAKAKNVKKPKSKKKASSGA